MLNKVLLIGRLCSDPESKYMANGIAVVNISIASSYKYKDKSSGEKKELTEFHRVVFFGKLAEKVGQYCNKGGLVYAEGRLQTRKYEKNGQDHYATEIIANEMKMLDSKKYPDNTSEPYKNNEKTPDYEDDILF